MEVELGEVWRESRARVRPADIAPTKYIGLEHVEGGTNRITGHKSSQDVKSAVAVFSAGDVLYGRLRPYLNKVIRPRESGVASTEFLVFEESPSLANALLLHLLSSSDTVGYANANSAGVNLPRVSAQQLGRHRICLPPLPEQHRIVAKIEDLFAKMDEGVTALKRAQANLERYRTSVLKAAIKGRLTEQWREQNPPEETGEKLLERILIERRKRWEEDQLAKFAANGRKPPRNWEKKYKEPVEPDNANLPDLPEGWCWATVDQVAEVTGGLTKNPKRNGLPAKYPYLRVANVYADEIRLDDMKMIGVSESELHRVLLRPGDLLVVEGNGSAEQIGRVAEWNGDLEPCCHQNHLIKVRCAPGIRSRWMLTWLLSPSGRQVILATASSTSGLYTLSLSKVRALPLPLAPTREQVCVVRLADSLRDTRKLVRDHVDTALAVRATSLRRSILQCAFQGRLVSQDPTDEAASVLLDRIGGQTGRQGMADEYHPALLTDPTRKPERDVSR